MHYEMFYTHTDTQFMHGSWYSVQPHPGTGQHTCCHVFFTRLGISSSNNKLYRLLYIRELNSHVNECPGGNLIWAQMSGVVIWCEHECPGWSFNVSTNVRGGRLMWARMSGPVKNRVGTNVRGNECPYTFNHFYEM